MDAEAETTWTRLSKSNLQPPRSIMNHKLCSIKSIPREKSPNTGNYIPDLLDTQHRIDQVGSLIQEAETASNHSQQRGYTTKINKMISETRTDLLNIEANFGGNIKLAVSWTLLAYATFSTKLIFTAPYKDKQELYRYELQDLESRIHNRIVITKRLLSDIALPVQSTVQEHIYRECLKRIKDLTTQATQDLQDIKTKHGIGNNIDKIEHFQVNLGIIKHRTRTTYTNICTWETQTKNQDDNKDALSKEKETNNNVEEANRPT